MTAINRLLTYIPARIHDSSEILTATLMFPVSGNTEWLFYQVYELKYMLCPIYFRLIAAIFDLWYAQA